MNDKKIRIGFVGAGQIAQHHLRLYKDIPGAEVRAIADIDEKLLERVSNEFGIPNTATDFREILKRDDIDAVDVCLHNNLHMPVAVAALEAGKDVYCEKPMAGSYRDAEKMMQAAKSLGRKLSIQLSTIFAPATLAAKKLIDEGRLGKIYHARSTGYRRRGRPYVDGYGTPAFVKKAVSAGGALYDMGVYHIAQILFLIGNPDITAVSGMTYQETPIDPARFKKSGYNVEELGLGFVRFAGGASMDVIESWAVHMGPFEASSIFGSQGGLRLDPLTYYHIIDDILVDSVVDAKEHIYREHSVKEIGSIYDNAQHHWIAALQGRVELLPLAEVALNTMLISEGIYLSALEKREVTADEVRSRSQSSALKLD